jgi:hypothetical protein
MFSTDDEEDNQDGATPDPPPQTLAAERGSQKRLTGRRPEGGSLP